MRTDEDVASGQHRPRQKTSYSEKELLLHRNTAPTPHPRQKLAGSALLFQAIFRLIFQSQIFP